MIIGVYPLIYFVTAVQWFEQALDISTDGNFQAYILTSLGVLLCSLGNVEGARDALEEAVRKDETQPNTWFVNDCATS